MEHSKEKSEWTGLKGKVGGWLLNSPIRRLLEKIFLGNSTPAFLNEVSKVIRDGDETVLDVGAGSGYFSLPIAEKLKSGKVVCLDLSDEMLSHLDRKARKKGLSDRIEILKASASSIGLDDNSIDLVVSSALLHELQHPEAAFSEMVRVLKKDGWILINDFRDIHGSHGDDVHGPFSVDELKGLFNENGLADIRVFPVKHWVIGTGKKINKT